jgi:hypothetical protein
MASWIESITVSIYMRIGMGSLCVVVMRSPVIIERAFKARLLLLPKGPVHHSGNSLVSNRS